MAELATVTLLINGGEHSLELDTRTSLRLLVRLASDRAPTAGAPSWRR